MAAVAFLDGGHCDATTLIEAAEDGWWYSAPLPDSRLAVMLVSDTVRPFTPSPLTRSRIDSGGYTLTTPPRRVDAGSARESRGRIWKINLA